ncbi:MAG: hypothetical protein V1909_06740 [Candidatus Micrarchaeota archaeon]
MTTMASPVYVKYGSRFKPATPGEMERRNEFFGKINGRARLDEGELFRSLGNRETLYAKKRGDEYVKATEEQAKKGKAVRFFHDPVMPRVEKVSATEFEQNRWRYDVVKSEKQPGDAALSQAGKTTVASPVNDGQAENALLERAGKTGTAMKMTVSVSSANHDAAASGNQTMAAAAGS